MRLRTIIEIGILFGLLVGISFAGNLRPQGHLDMNNEFSIINLVNLTLNGTFTSYGNMTIKGNLFVDNINVSKDMNTSNVFILNLFATNLERDLDGTGFKIDIGSLIASADVNSTNLFVTTIEATNYGLVENDVPTLSSSWANSMDADQLTGIDFLNSQITLAGENITAGTVAGARLPPYTNATVGDMDVLNDTLLVEAVNDSIVSQSSVHNNTLLVEAVNDSIVSQASIYNNTLLIEAVNDSISPHTNATVEDMNILNNTLLVEAVNDSIVSQSSVYNDTSLSEAVNDSLYSKFARTDISETFDINVVVTGNLTVLGVNLGANVTTLKMNGSFLPNITDVFNIGSPSLKWLHGYFVGDLNSTQVYTTNLFATNLEKDLDGTGFMIDIADLVATGDINTSDVFTTNLFATNLEKNLDSTGFKITGGSITGVDANFTGLGHFATVDTGQGDNEIYDMNQNVLSTSDVTFNDIVSTGNITGDINWTYLNTYPSACPTGSAITQLNDSVICTDMGTDITVLHNLSEINKVFYVQPSNGTDLYAKLALCDGVTPCTVVVGCGNHTLISGLSGHLYLEGNTHLAGSGYCSLVTGNTRSFLVRNGAQHIEISGLRMDNIGGIYFYNGTNNHVHIHDNYFDNTSSRSIFINGTYVQINNNYISSRKLGGISINRAHSQSGPVVISSNTIRCLANLSGSEYGEGIDINTYAKNVTAIITGNDIAGCREQGIECNAGYCLISNNRVKMASDETRTNYGIAVQLSTEENNRTSGFISNNIITGVTRWGIGSIITKDFQIIGNVIRGIGKDSSNSIGIQASGSRLSVIGNSIEDVNKSIHAQGGAINNLILLSNLYHSVNYPVWEGTAKVRLDSADFIVNRNLTVLNLRVLGNVSMATTSTSTFRSVNISCSAEPCTPLLEVSGATGDIVRFLRATGNAYGPIIDLKKARGIPSSTASANDNDEMGVLRWQFYNGSKYLSGARLAADVLDVNPIASVDSQVYLDLYTNNSWVRHITWRDNNTYVAGSLNVTEDINGTDLYLTGNITFKSPNSSFYKCGINNTGHWKCMMG